MKQRKRVSKRHRRGFSLTCRYPTLFLWWYSFKVVPTMYTSFQLSSGFNLKRTGQKAVQIHSSTFVQLYQHWGLYAVTMTTYHELQLPALITWKFIRWSRSPIFWTIAFCFTKRKCTVAETKCKGEKEIFECEISFSNSTLLKNQRKIKAVGRRTFFLVKCMEISKKNTTFIFRKIAFYSCAAMTTADCSLYWRHLLILLTVLSEKNSPLVQSTRC